MMNDYISSIPTNDLLTLATALRSGRLLKPFSEANIKRYVATDQVENVVNIFESLDIVGFNEQQIASTIQLILLDRDQRKRLEDEIQLVTTGPEAETTSHRDTAVVVRDLFANANESVVVVGYAVYQGQQVFKALADRMKEKRDLDVNLYIDIKRPLNETTVSELIVKRFYKHFIENEWPLDRPVPKIFYYAPSLEIDATVKSSLHAKCVIVDKEKIFISSANFTEAAHTRNVEAGVLFDSSFIANKLTLHFQNLSQLEFLKEI